MTEPKNKLQNEIMRSDEEEFFVAVENYLKNGIAPIYNEFNLKVTPEILQYAGIPNHKIIMTTKVLNKAKDEAHNLDNEEILSALKGLSDPVIIFESDKEKSEAKGSSVLIFTEANDKNNKPLAIGFEMEIQKQGENKNYVVNKIRSVHPRTTLINSKGENMLEKWTEKGLMKYVDDKKISEWLKDRQVQFLLSLTNADTITITDSSGNVKSFSVKTKANFERQAEKIQAIVNQQRTNLAEVEYLNLDSLTRILDSFGNVKQIFTKDSDIYAKAIDELQAVTENLLTPKEYLKNLLSKAKIEMVEDAGIMRAILAEGKNVQKMAVKYGTNQNLENGSEESFSGFGTYVVSVNEENAKQLGIKIAAKKYGGNFYINEKPFNEFLQEKNFSPYWISRLEQFKDSNIGNLADDFLTADVKGNATLEKERDTLATLFSLDLIEYKREQTFLYSVDIPDNDSTNYLLYGNPIGIEHANRINEQLEKLNVGWRVSRNDIGKNVYFNTLSEKVFGGSRESASKFLKEIGYVGMEMNHANYIVFSDKDMKVTNRVQYMIDGENNIYGFAYDGRIYADPEIAESGTYAHEYTHLWDAYTQRTNPELWEKGKNIFKGTVLWNEVMSDANYKNLSNDDEILSECHSRIVGKMAEKILNRIAEKNGGLLRDQVIDWDKEVAEYIAGELGAEFPKPELGNENYVSEFIRYETAREFLAQPMKDLTAGKDIVMGQEKESALSEEDLEYIRSPEFIEKFGDWEKAQRLEKLKAAESLTMNSQVIVNKRDVSKEITKLRETYSRENLKSLQKYADAIGKEILAEERKRQGLNEYENPKFKNNDTGKEFFFQSMSIREIRHHNLFQKGHIEALQKIPEIIGKSVYIGKERNEDDRNSDLKNFHYFGCGIKIDGEDYTCKAVFAENRHGELFYDQSLSTIEKGKFVDLVNQKNKPVAFNPQQQGWDSNELYERNLNPFEYYDKRLINICQVPQMKYLDKNLMPTKEAVEAVRNGTLRVEKKGQTEIMVDETQNAGTERIQKMATPAENVSDLATSARALPDERETAERLWRAATTDYDDPIEAKEAWH
ncbi:MAG: hypothetical protein NC219_08825, partial [Prevotella sp.]|nr:hypothetical protein [Prevotella sp.]